MPDSDAKHYLEQIGHSADDEIDVAQAALKLSSVHYPSKNTDRAYWFLDSLKNDMQPYKTLDTAAEQIAAIQTVLFGTHKFKGDETSYDDLQNADLPAVIDRRKGIPITLAILVLTCAQSVGWSVQGVNFPGHFLVRFNAGSARLLCDPFDALQVMDAPGLRRILKNAHGDSAELSSDFFEPTTNREILLRLENNIKARQVNVEDYAAALETVRIMRLIAPNDARVCFDEGLLLARLDEPKSAIKALETYRDKADNLADKEQAAQIIQALKMFLN